MIASVDQGRGGGRREDAPLLTGRGRFVDDLAPPGCLVTAVLRTDQAMIGLTSPDTSDAMEMPGVRLVLTGADFAGCGKAAINPFLPMDPPTPFEPLVSSRAWAVGQPVAAVVAETLNQALDALETLVPDTEPADFDREHPIATEQWSTGREGAATRGVSVVTRWPVAAPTALEPRAVLAIPDGDRLTVHVTSQSVHRVRDNLATILSIDPEKLRVVATDVGGSFGAKASITPEDVVVAEAARRLQCPVKWTATRQEEMQGGALGRGAELLGTLFLDAEGAPVAVSADLRFPLGAWMPFSALVPMRNAGRILPGPYAIEDVDIAGAVRLGPTSAIGIYRGAGRPEAALLLERLMDLAARDQDVDPLEYRRRHVLPAFSTPLRTPTGEMLDSGDYPGLLDALALKGDYIGRRAAVAERRRSGEVVGLGIALYIEPCGVGHETATLTAFPDGTFLLASGSSAQGQGRETAYARIAAEVLGCSADRVIVRHGDTETCPDGVGAFASRGTAIGGSAVLSAAREMAERLSRFGGVLPAEGSTVHVRYEPEGEAWASGACLAQIRIDAETGVPAVEDIVWIDDAGVVIDPVLVEGQLLGGLAQGLGTAMMEGMIYDEDGQLLSGSLMDYAVPRAADMPPVRIDHLHTATEANALGAKGVGEAGCIGVPAAIGNAVMDALAPYGVRHLDFPFTSEKLWRAMNGSAQGA